MKGTELEGFQGPDAWQIKVLHDMQVKLQAGAKTGVVIRDAIRSGHGIGKSALVAWIILWAISTFAGTRGVITAGKEQQLRTKTWAELAKWHSLFVGKDMFRVTATAICSASAQHEKTWRIDATPWSEHNTEAFAGLHNIGKRLLLIFDEGSAIADKVYEVAQGALTDANTQIIWLVFGNPTKNTGWFHDIFFRWAHRWTCWAIDSRHVKQSNKTEIQGWVDDYGEDSDFVRVRVKGEFARVGSTQFISTLLAETAQARVILPPEYERHPTVMGVDVARFGDDQTVFAIRKGPKLFHLKKFRGLDTVEVAGRVIEVMRNGQRIDSICVDGIGIGAGVVDVLKREHINVVDVNVSVAAVDARTYSNKRSELWGNMRQWLETADIEHDPELIRDLTSIEYGYNAKMQIQLEKKSDLKARGMQSPDCADAVSLTFADAPIPTLRSKSASRPVVNVRWK